MTTGSVSSAPVVRASGLLSWHPLTESHTQGPDTAALGDAVAVGDAVGRKVGLAVVGSDERAADDAAVVGTADGLGLGFDVVGVVDAVGSTVGSEIDGVAVGCALVAAVGSGATYIVSIMPMSSCLRKWQCSTVSPAKSLNAVLAIVWPARAATVSRQSPTLPHTPSVTALGLTSLV